MNKRKFTFFCFFIFFASALFAKEPSHVTVKVKPGDVLFRILSKYELYEHSCNVDAFYTINGMSKGDHILANKTYNLPIKTYNYNGESIRSTIGDNDWDRAVAIQDYNKKLSELGLKTYYREDKILYVPYHLADCSISAPSVSSEADIIEEIEYVETDIYFGSENKIRKESEKLKNQVFYIIAGHGGPDPGAMCSKSGHSLCEDEYAYDVSLRLAKNLLINGATVHMIIQDPNDGIRDETYLKLDRDEICKVEGTIPLNQRQRLDQRSNAVNKLYRQESRDGITKTHKVIAIHVDSRSTSLRQDVFFYYAPGSNSGKKLATDIQNTFKEKYAIHQKGRGYSGSVTSRNLYVLRKTAPTAVYVELANLQNVNNQKRILPYTNRQVLANWLYEGLIK